MEEPKTNYLKYWPLAVGVLAIVGTWAGFKSHMSDDSQHLSPNEITLTKTEYNNLLKFATQVELKLPEIETLSKINHENLTEINKTFYGFNIRFDILYEEHEGLESKVSKNYVELNNEIKTLHD